MGGHDTTQGSDKDDLWLKSHQPTSSKELAMHSTRVIFVHLLAILSTYLLVTTLVAEWEIYIAAYLLTKHLYTEKMEDVRMKTF